MRLHSWPSSSTRTSSMCGGGSAALTPTQPSALRRPTPCLRDGSATRSASTTGRGTRAGAAGGARIRLSPRPSATTSARAPLAMDGATTIHLSPTGSKPRSDTGRAPPRASRTCRRPAAEHGQPVRGCSTLSLHVVPVLLGRGDRLDDLERRFADALEQPLARPQQDRDDVRNSSSSSPAARYWLTVLAPPATCTFCSPAAARACSSAASIPSLTK